MASYYYLMSSLPMLKPSGDMPFSYDSFLEMCASNISETKYNLLKNLTLESTDGPLVSEWAKFYSVFKAELSFQRNQKLSRPCETPYDRDDSIVRAVASAIDDENPLDAEKGLLDLQFQKLDLLIGTHSFDDFSLFGYALKLKLIERRSSFNQKSGREELDRMVDGLQKQILSIG